MDREKLGFVLLAVVSLVGIVILAAALDGFAFTSPYHLLETSSEQQIDLSHRDELMRLVFIVMLVLLPIVTVLLILASRRHRRILLFLLAIAVVAYLISTSSTGDQPLGNQALVNITPEIMQSVLITPEPTLAALPAEEEVVVTPTLIWLISLGLGGMLVGMAALVWLAWRAFRRPISPLQAIIASAETALQALGQGEDIQSTILRCYQTMLSAAVQAKGVERPEYLTPAEFVQRLVKAGLPREPVERLTHLFETVRYSMQPSTSAMEAEAVSCLQDVITMTKENA